MNLSELLFTVHDHVHAMPMAMACHVRTTASVAAMCAIVTIMIAQTHFSSLSLRLRHANVIG